MTNQPDPRHPRSPDGESPADLVTVLEPDDEYPHQPDPVPNYNESMYLNCFDIERAIGGWFRLGNRVNEGYAEMTVCLYLPGGRVGFMYGRPPITTNDRMAAGGLEIEVLVPFERLRVAYAGQVCLLDDPGQMADPRVAFTQNPSVPCTVELDITGISPMYGGRPVRADGREIVQAAEQSFAKAHYEQHISATGTLTVGGDTLTFEGLGLRDKSWGPRYWQAVSWYRWLPMVFGSDFAMMLSLVGGGPDGRDARASGMVLSDGVYTLLDLVEIDSDWDADGYQTAMRCRARTVTGEEYQISGEVLSLIPLRNRRSLDDGTVLHTRITEAMTRFTCNGRTGIGMSEYLDQVVDGRPVGPDIAL